MTTKEPWESFVNAHPRDVWAAGYDAAKKQAAALVKGGRFLNEESQEARWATKLNAMILAMEPIEKEVPHGR